MSADISKLFAQKERLPLAEYVAAALVDVARKRELGITAKLEDLPQILSEHFKTSFDPQEIADAIEILAECNLAYVAQDALAGHFIRISEEKFLSFVALVDRDKERYRNAIDASGDDPQAFFHADQDTPTPSWDQLKKFKVLEKYREFGSPFVEQAVARVEHTDLPNRLILGSDRLISFSDNLPIVENIRKGLDQLQTEIQTNNAFADALGDARDEVISEVTVLQTTMAGTQSRAGYLLALSRRILGWIGRLAGETSAKEIVKYVTKLFIEWLA